MIVNQQNLNTLHSSMTTAVNSFSSNLKTGASSIQSAMDSMWRSPVANELAANIKSVLDTLSEDVATSISEINKAVQVVVASHNSDEGTQDSFEGVSYSAEKVSVTLSESFNGGKGVAEGADLSLITSKADEMSNSLQNDFNNLKNAAETAQSFNTAINQQLVSNVEARINAFTKGVNTFTTTLAERIKGEKQVRLDTDELAGRAFGTE